MAKIRSFTVGEMIETSPVEIGNVGEALRAALAAAKEREGQNEPDHFEGNLGANIAGGRV